MSVAPALKKVKRRCAPGRGARLSTTDTYSVAELAKRWDVTVQTVYQRIREGKLAPEPLPIGKRTGLRVSAAEVKRFEADARRTA